MKILSMRIRIKYPYQKDEININEYFYIERDSAQYQSQTVED